MDAVVCHRGPSRQENRQAGAEKAAVIASGIIISSSSIERKPPVQCWDNREGVQRERHCSEGPSYEDPSLFKRRKPEMKGFPAKTKCLRKWSKGATARGER